MVKPMRAGGYRLRGWHAALCAGLAIGPLPAHAAETDRNAADIVVTAQKRPERRLDVPAALSTVSGDEIERLGVRTYRDLSFYTPGFFAETLSPVQTFVAIRGVATSLSDVASEPRVSIFQDGVSTSRLQGSLSELFDVQRVEVVKGPQSTLFGRSALTGAVSILTNRADPAARTGEVVVEGGNLGTVRVDAAGNLPLGEGAAIRLAGRFRRADGYVGNLLGGPDLNGTRTAALRGSLHLEPGDAIKVDLIGNYEHTRFTGTSYKSGVFVPTDPATGAVTGTLSPYSAASLSLGSAVAGSDRLGGWRRTGGATLLVDARLSDRFTLSSISGYRGFDLVSRQDQDGAALTLLSGADQAKGDQLSQELRLAYDNDSGFRAFIGGSLFHETLDRTIPLRIDERQALFLLTGALNRNNPVPPPAAAFASRATLAAILTGAVRGVGGVLPAAQAAAIAANLTDNHQEAYRNRSRTDAADLFADASLDVLPRLTIQGGIRLTIDDKRLRFSSRTEGRSVLAGFLAALRLPAAQRGALLAALSAPGAGTIPQSATYPVPLFAISQQPTGQEGERNLTDAGLAWRLNARYALSETANVYASYARGRRPEVTSAAAPTVPGGAAVFTDLSPETIDSFEVGTKFATPDHRFSLEASGYHYSYRNFQTQAVQGARIISIDAGRARARGVEVETNWRPLPWATLFATYAWSHARFTGGAYDGNRFRLNPDHSASAGAILRAGMGAGAIEFSPSVTYRSRLYFDESNGNPALLAGAVLAPVNYDPSQKGYALANVALGYAPGRANWRIDARVSNLFDKRYLRDTSPASLAFGLPSYVAAPPRVATLSLTIRG